ncbi:MAG: hypothetical protein J6R29_01525 [Clostridia bacterium]|nr:hypothetical protein [Clostridia bacterium]
MDWKDLAPWIAIAITLALSILVPFFTQIANNKHQRKMQKEKLDFAQAKEDVLPFVKDKSKLDLWSKEFFIEITKQLQ